MRGSAKENTDIHEIMEAPIITLPTILLHKEASRIVTLLKQISLKKIRNILEEYGLIRRIEEHSRMDIRGIAIDTGFTDPPLELTGGKLITILRAHVYFGFKPKNMPLADVKGFIRFIQGDESIAKPLSKIIERKFILKILKEKSKGKDEIDLILLDGELFPRVPPGLIRKRGESTISKLYTKYLKVTKRVLELADKTDTALVGVIKRVYGYDITILSNIPHIRINDKALATYILEPGEWLYLKTYADIEVQLENVIERYKDKIDESKLRSLRERYRWIKAVTNVIEQASNIDIAIYKAPTPSYFMLATKVELWPSMSLLREDLITYLAHITGVHGVPHPIDTVDTMARITPELLHTIQQQLFNQISQELKDPKLALSIAGLTNPEKLRIIGIK